MDKQVQEKAKQAAKKLTAEYISQALQDLKGAIQEKEAALTSEVYQKKEEQIKNIAKINEELVQLDKDGKDDIIQEKIAENAAQMKAIEAELNQIEEEQENKVEAKVEAYGRQYQSFLSAWKSEMETVKEEGTMAIEQDLDEIEFSMQSKIILQKEINTKAQELRETRQNFVKTYETLEINIENLNIQKEGLKGIAPKAYLAIDEDMKEKLEQLREVSKQKSAIGDQYIDLMKNTKRIETDIQDLKDSFKKTKDAGKIMESKISTEIANQESELKTNLLLKDDEMVSSIGKIETYMMGLGQILNPNPEKGKGNGNPVKGDENPVKGDENPGKGDEDPEKDDPEDPEKESRFQKLRNWATGIVRNVGVKIKQAAHWTAHWVADKLQNIRPVKAIMDRRIKMLNAGNESKVPEEIAPEEVTRSEEGFRKDTRCNIEKVLGLSQRVANGLDMNSEEFKQEYDNLTEYERKTFDQNIDIAKRNAEKLNKNKTNRKDEIVQEVKTEEEVERE